MVKTTVQHVGPSGQSSRAATLRVAHCSTGMSITISDSSSDDNSVDKSKQKLKMVAKHCAGGRYSGKVLDTTMSKLLSIFPNVCPTAAASHLSKHLQRTSPETALQRTVHHFLVKGVPASTVEVTPGEEIPSILPLYPSLNGHVFERQNVSKKFVSSWTFSGLPWQSLYYCTVLIGSDIYL